MSVDFSGIRNTGSLENFLAVPNGFLQNLLDDFEDYIEERRVSKKDGSIRIVYEAVEVLANAHKVFQAQTKDSFPIHRSAYGYTKGKTAQDNAELHAGKRTIVKIDIRDFFNSIKDSVIVEQLVKIGFKKNIAEILTPIFCTNKSLEAGFCPSTMIANAVCFDLDVELQEWSDDHNVIYSRYSDDMTFSSDRRLDFSIDAIEIIIRKFGFELSSKKTKFMFRGEPQYVTGFPVTESGRPQAPKDLKSELRKDLYYIGKYGIADHVSKKYDNSAIEKEIERLFGMIGYIYGIEPAYIEKLRSKNLLPKGFDRESFYTHCFRKKDIL